MRENRIWHLGDLETLYLLDPVLRQVKQKRLILNILKVVYEIWQSETEMFSPVEWRDNLPKSSRDYKVV